MRSINTKYPDLLERIVEILVPVTLAFLPLAFGTVEAWSEQVFLMLVAVLSTLALVRWIVVPQVQVVRSWIYLFLGLVTAVAALQLLSLPTGLLENISANTVRIKEQYLSDVPNAGNLLARMTLSFYPQATIHDLRLFLAVSAFLMVVLNIYQRPTQIKRLLTSIALIGGSIALVAIFQIVSQTDKIYWIVATGHGVADAGPFIHHNHFAQFMNLSIGAAIARLLIELQEQLSSQRDLSVQDIVEFLGSSHGALSWMMAVVVVLGITSIFLSLSRGGMISLLIAGSFTTLMISLKQNVHQGRGKVIVLIALIALVCILYIGFDAVYERLETLHDFNEAGGERWQVIKDVVLAWTHFPLFGTGLGTHEVVYPMFDSLTISALSVHANNEYAQFLEETGIFGFTLLLGIVVLTCWSFVKTVRRMNVPIQMAAFGLGYGLLAITVHSLSDFGQRLPANAVLTATFVALLINLSRHANPRPSCETVKPLNQRAVKLILGLPILLAVVLLWIWSIIGANRARIAENHWTVVTKIEEELIKSNWQGTDPQYIKLLTDAAAAAKAQPNSIHYRHWLNVYRWHTISRTTDPNTGDLILLPETLAFTQQIIDELHQARILCPTYGQTLCLIGQLEYTVFDDPNGIDHIQQGYELAPNDAITCYLAGVIDAEQGRQKTALAKFQQAIQLDSRLYETVAQNCCYQLSDPDLAFILAENNIGRLRILAEILSNATGENELEEKIRIQIREQIEIACERDDAAADTFVSLARLQHHEGNNDAAIANYRQALMRNYNNVSWRYELSRLLVDDGQAKEAIHEARICLRLQTDCDWARKLIADLSVRPDVVLDGR
ncbi:O-antigen ligase family protein [Planctomycetota bacterium]